MNSIEKMKKIQDIKKKKIDEEKFEEMMEYDENESYLSNSDEWFERNDYDF